MTQTSGRICLQLVFQKFSVFNLPRMMSEPGIRSVSGDCIAISVDGHDIIVLRLDAVEYRITK